MNCRNFETTITELARGQMLEARSKEDALRHVEECKHCAARFADEKALTAGLRAVTASTAKVATPLHVEETLLSAFRQRRDMSSAPALTFAPTRVMPRWMPWSIAAAAALIVVAALAVSRLLPISSSESVSQEARVNQPARVPSPSSSTQEETVPDQQKSSVRENPNQESVSEMKPAYAQYRPRSPLRSVGSNGGGIHRDINYGSTTSAREELTTDFLPLTYGSDLAQLEEGQVIRVELPRSALQSLGLPMNVERAGDRIKADVLLGNDGIARAIRFVR